MVRNGGHKKEDAIGMERSSKSGKCNSCRKQEMAQKQEKKGKEVMRKDGKMSSWQQMKEEITLWANYSGQPTFLSFCIILGRIPSRHTHAHTPSNCTLSHPHYLYLGFFFGEDEAHHLDTSCEGGGSKCEIKRTWVGGWGVKQRTSGSSVTITVLKSCEILFFSAMANCNILSCNWWNLSINQRHIIKVRSEVSWDSEKQKN